MRLGVVTGKGHGELIDASFGAPINNFIAPFGTLINTLIAPFGAPINTLIVSFGAPINTSYEQRDAAAINSVRCSYK